MKRYFYGLAVLILAASFLAGCGGGNSGSGKPAASGSAAGPTGNSSVGAAASQAASPSGSGEIAAGKFDAVYQMLDEYNRLGSLYEGVLNGKDEYLDLQLSLIDTHVGMMSGIPLTLNNTMNEDGKFGDPGSKSGFTEKQGDKITMELDYTVPASEAFGTTKAGDRKIQSGAADLSAGTMWFEDSQERGGAVLSHNRYDYLTVNAKVTALSQTSSGKEDNVWNNAVFIVIDEKSYEFVTGRAKEGPSRKPMNFDANMSAADAKAMLESAGYTIEFYGSVEGGEVIMR